VTFFLKAPDMGKNMCRKTKDEDWLNQKYLELETMEMKQDLSEMHTQIER
jgi:hypothetical protein